MRCLNRASFRHDNSIQFHISSHFEHREKSHNFEIPFEYLLYLAIKKESYKKA